MSLYDNSLLELARQVSRDAPPSSPQGRQRIESALLPIIRVALRTGRGPMPVVNWVRDEVGPNRWPLDPTAAASPLARQLCDRLLDRLDPLPSRDTVAGP